MPVALALLLGVPALARAQDQPRRGGRGGDRPSMADRLKQELALGIL